MRLRLCLAVLIFFPCAGRSELRDVLKSSDIDKLFSSTRPQSASDILVKPNYTISLRVKSGEDNAWQAHKAADEVWFIRSGAATIFLNSDDPANNAEHKTGSRSYEVSDGDVVNVPRTTDYRINAKTQRFHYVAVQIFPTKRRTNWSSRSRTDQPMPDVVRGSTIQATFASAQKNVGLHYLGAAGMNHVVYLSAPGPFEVHLACDDIYFLRLGTANARLDGYIVDPKEDSPGEIRGTGVTGARDYKIGVGDILSIPRNTAHYMDPGAAKLGYLLLKVYD